MTHTAALDAAALEAPAGSSGWLREVVVHISMMIVVGALGIALRASLGLGIVPSVVTALVVYWGLLLVHALVRRGQDVAELSDELSYLEDENAELRQMVGGRRPITGREMPRGGALDPPARAAPNVYAKADRAAAAPPARPAAAKMPARAPEAPAKAGPGAMHGAAARAPVRPPISQQSSRAPAAASKPSAPPNGRTIPPPLPAGRPLAQGLAALVAERPAHVPPPREDAARVAPKLPMDSPREAEDPRAQDIAIMQSLIKGLADQLNAPAKVEPPRPAQSLREIPADAPAPTLDTVDDQVGALRQAASALRAPPAPEFGAPSLEMPPLAIPSLDMPPLGVPPLGIQEPGGDLSLHAQLAGAIEASRIDIYLDPILGLEDRKARHFEVSVRLRNDDGELLDPRDFASAIAGTGLGPRIEAHTFTESIRLAGQFATRGAEADLFAGASAETIRDTGFRTALAGALAPDAALAARLVMSIAQSEVRGFGPAHWEAIAAMAHAGLRYALVDVVDLDMDFEALEAHGFDFVRLDASVFLRGLPAPHGFVPAADLCRHLSGLGFTLIVSRIADERELVKVFGFGAVLGQGRLFGAPRPIRLDRVPRRSSAA